MFREAHHARDTMETRVPSATRAQPGTGQVTRTGRTDRGAGVNELIRASSSGVAVAGGVYSRASAERAASRAATSASSRSPVRVPSAAGSASHRLERSASAKSSSSHKGPREDFQRSASSRSGAAGGGPGRTHSAARLGDSWNSRTQSWSSTGGSSFGRTRSAARHQAEAGGLNRAASSSSSSTRQAGNERFVRGTAPDSARTQGAERTGDCDGLFMRVRSLDSPERVAFMRPIGEAALASPDEVAASDYSPADLSPLKLSPLRLVRESVLA